MHIDWVIECENILQSHEGPYTLVGIGQNGFMLTAGTVGVVQTAVMMCLVMDDDDEPGLEDEIWHQVIGPEGTPITAIRRTVMQWNPGDSPQRVDPERHYIPIGIAFDIDVGGPYTVEIGTLTETREIPLRVQEIPSPE